MNTQVIMVNINKELELYEELRLAGLNNTEYDGCCVMQWSEHRGDNYQMVAEFMLRESEENPPE